MQYSKREIHIDYDGCGLEPPKVLPVLHEYLLLGEGADNVMLSKLRPAIIICAGGGYTMRAYHEGEPIALKFLSEGYQAFVLDYSVMPMLFPGALLELSKAVATVRENAEAYRIDKNRIFVGGFSAGGHLAASLGVYWNESFVTRSLGFDNRQNQPNGLMLCYPVISGNEEIAHLGSMRALLGEYPSKDEIAMFSLENHVSDNTPPAFLWHTADDSGVDVRNSLCFASALKKADIDFELHIYKSGDHGISLANEVTAAHLGQLAPDCQGWIDLSIKFFNKL